MSQEVIRAAITGRFATQWGTASPVQYPNHAFKTPENAPWARLSIAQADRYDAAIGAGLVRDIGVVYLQLFAPDESGSKALMDLADLFCSAFDNVSLTSGSTALQFHRVKIAQIGKTTQGPYQVNASVDYRADTEE